MTGERLIRGPRDGFARGESPIVREEDVVGFDFSIRRLAPDEIVEERSPKESVWLLLHGDASVTFDGLTQRASRSSLFDEAPSALHVAGGTPIAIVSRGESEWASIRATNDRRFAPRLFEPLATSVERRGKGLAQEMSVRDVRLVFDLEARPESKLVVGEVINLPGRWSSYPPHHHAQPELYHYRFSAPQGYGHAELDDDVFKVRSGDSITIRGGETHAQVSAPGYAMYYLWVVRHLEGRPYRGFEFAPEHRWLLDPANQGWRPRHGDA